MSLDVKYIFLDHIFDALQWYESIQTHGDTWEVVILPSPNIFKVNPIGYGWKIQFLSAEIISKRIYMSKLIAKILNAKTMLGPECFSYNEILRETKNGGYTALCNIIRVVHPLIMNESDECHIPYRKN